jgi:hypothetical protein
MSFDEVSVYPIPAVLYMVKNLLQDSFAQFFCVKFELLLLVAFSIIHLHMWMHQLTRY